MSNTVTTTAALARELGFSISAFGKWRKAFPDAPAGIEVEAWRAFIAKHGLGTKGNFQSESKTALAERKLRAESRLLEIKIAKEERKLIDSADIDSFLLHLSSRLKSSLYQTFQTELPPKTAGLDVAEVRRLNREACDIVCGTMQTLQDEWQAEQERAREAAAQVAEEHGED